MRKAISILLVTALLSGCSTVPRKRFYYGAAIGAGVGAVGGAVLSPNQQSRGLNAIVFGLAGAIIGGLSSLFFKDDSELPKSNDSLESRELKTVETKEYSVPVSSDIPAFVKARLQPVVIEEYTERNRVGEDGSLQESHKAWRIKRQAEFSAEEIESNKESKK